MQTFLPYESFAFSAEVLDNKRLGKQRVEAFQILKALDKGEFQCSECGESMSRRIRFGYCEKLDRPATTRVTPWYNHPATQLWLGYEPALEMYIYAVCNEWKRRGFKDTIAARLDRRYALNPKRVLTITLPKLIGHEPFHASHRSNLLRKDPEHYSQFGWKEPDNLHYIWKI